MTGWIRVVVVVACVLAFGPHLVSAGGSAVVQLELTAYSGLDQSHAWRACGVTSAGNPSACYLTRYPDVAADPYWGAHPAEHFTQHGQFEGRVWGCDTLTLTPANAPFDLGDGTHGIQCVDQPGSVVSFTGTSTVKQVGVEVLAWVQCGTTRIWQGEQIGPGTISIFGFTDVGIAGPCWFGEQSLSRITVPSVYELQMTIFFRVP